MCQRSAGEERCRRRNKSVADKKGPECSGLRSRQVEAASGLKAPPTWVARRRRRTSQSAPACRPYRLSFFPYRNAAMCRFRFIFYDHALQRRAIVRSL
ncbi:unnamed protein product [Leptosia nina]|uniref:Uncharacterized protein n=1 Tax=Leptosia nina TaxID=320188 RepID=A0AAV1JDN3_9NEOP